MPTDWIHIGKEDIFPDNDHITGNLCWIIQNMKKVWKEAKLIQEQLGLGLMVMVWLIAQSNLRAMYIDNAIAKNLIYPNCLQEPKRSLGARGYQLESLFLDS